VCRQVRRVGCTAVLTKNCSRQMVQPAQLTMTTRRRLSHGRNTYLPQRRGSCLIRVHFADQKSGDRWALVLQSSRSKGMCLDLGRRYAVITCRQYDSTLASAQSTVPGALLPALLPLVNKQGNYLVVLDGVHSAVPSQAALRADGVSRAGREPRLHLHLGAGRSCLACAQITQEHFSKSDQVLGARSCQRQHACTSAT